MEKPIRFTFSNGRTAQATQVKHTGELSVALHELGLRSTYPALVLIGGASKMEGEEVDRLRPLFAEGLVRPVATLGAAIIDGGTGAGVMHLIGEARASFDDTFPLIGVAAIGTIARPDEPNPPRKAAHLEPHHTHFVLVPGTHWGDESPWLSYVAGALSAGAGSVTILVNGGEIAWEDVARSVKVGRPVIVIAGSGRTVDVLASALRGVTTDGRAKKLVASELLQMVDGTSNVEALANLISKTLSAKAGGTPAHGFCWLSLATRPKIERDICHIK